MTGKELVNEIRELIIANEFLGEGDDDINNKIIGLLKDNLKSLVEIDEKKLAKLIDDEATGESFNPDSGDYEDAYLGQEESERVAGLIVKENPIKLKEVNDG